MKTIKATYQIVTPMFIGDADGNATSLRPPSIKGALRFWWRALNWGKFQKIASTNEKALQKLYEKESRLFGAAATDDGGGGQGCFLLKLDAKKVKPLEKSALPEALTEHQYLLGQGLYDHKKGYLRNALNMDKFSVYLYFHPKTSQDNRESIARCLLFLGLLGGLGSRVHRGFGALSIQKLEGSAFTIPQNLSSYKTLFEELKSDLIQPLPPFTAFSKEMRLDYTLEAADILKDNAESAWSLLAQAGKEMLLYRSYGRNGKVVGVKAERNFENDHDLIQDVLNRKTVTKHPERVVFGLPHNYFFSSSKKSLEVHGKDEKAKRRASPLFIHPHIFPDGSVKLFQLLLPAIFLPNGSKIELAPKERGNNSQLFNVNVDYQHIHKYMDRLKKETII